MGWTKGPDLGTGGASGLARLAALLHGASARGAGAPACALVREGAFKQYLRPGERKPGALTDPSDQSERASSSVVEDRRSRVVHVAGNTFAKARGGERVEVEEAGRTHGEPASNTDVSIVAAPRETPLPAAAHPWAGTFSETSARVSLEDLLPALVRKLAWSADANRAALRLEFGAGALRGATVLVQTEGNRVRVTISVPGGVDADGWRDRIAARLAGRGMEVAEVQVEGGD